MPMTEDCAVIGPSFNRSQEEEKGQLGPMVVDSRIVDQFLLNPLIRST
jgi:hypothetical protein